MSKQKRGTEWFVEPQDAHSNEIIAREVAEEDLCREVLCEDKIPRILWRCSFDLVKFFWQSRSCAGLNIKVFNRRINSGTSRGKARDVTFLLRHKMPKSFKKIKLKK